MIELLLIGFTFMSVFALAFGYFSKNNEASLDESVGIAERREWSSQTSLIRHLYPLIKLLQPIVRLMPLPSIIADRYKRWIISAGMEGLVFVADIVGLQVTLAIAFALMSNVWFDSGYKLIVLFSIIGFFLPVMWLHQAAKERRAQILRSLPSVVDMISLSVGAGIDFNSAVKRVVEKEHGADSKNESSELIYELSIYLKNVRLGMSRTDALETLAERVDAPDIYSFVAILIQADKIGASISDTLQQQAVTLREERFLQAEKAGAVASQKIMIPMMLFIFPLIFAIILLPLLLKFVYN